MADPAAMSALVKSQPTDVALMPPPPVRRIMRPAIVLDEDDYTSALSDIIARDYFPGLLEGHAQQEYLTALESGNNSWIQEAGQKLQTAMTPLPAGKSRRSTRNTRFDTPKATPRPLAGETPRGDSGSETPASVAGTNITEDSDSPALNTSTYSLSAFQARYTSEDNESFNALLDKQNLKRREKHAHLWTQDQRLLSARQIAHRARETRLLKQKAEDEATGKALIPMTTGATDSRPAKPDAWQIQKPDNTFMFPASSVEDDGLPTIVESREAASKAGPRHVVYANTRFPAISYNDDGPIPPSPSLNTSIIARRDAARADSNVESDYAGGETPRVNGYAFVDEDEPENLPPDPTSEPSYRDLLAGQAGDGTPNPFRLGNVRKREALHHRMVERVAKKKRLRDKETVKTPLIASAPGTPVGGDGANNTPLNSVGAGNMTPAARKLLEKLGRTPVGGREGGQGRMSSKEMWTPVLTPRVKGRGK